MRFCFAASAILPFLITFAAAQTPTFQPPNVRSGLWQTKVTMTMTGMGNSAPDITTAQSCITPESLKEDIQHFGLQDKSGAHCTASNIHQDAHRITFDESCDIGNQKKTKIHYEMVFDSAEHSHGTAEITTFTPNMPKGMAMHIKTDSHYLKSDCGSLKPGEDSTQ